jgi:monoamine oxidase
VEKLKGIGRVAVVGGGFAGLMAALRLIEHGVKVTVFEAHNDVGGRVRSNKTFVEGRITEFGAELIGSFHTKWLGLARKYGLAVINRMDPELYQRAGLDVKLTLEKRLSNDEFLKRTKDMNDKVLLPIALLAKLIKDPSRPWNQKWLKTDWPMTKLDHMSVAVALEKILKVKRDGPLWKFIEFKLVNDEVATLDDMNFLGLLCKVRGGQGERFGEGLKPILMGYWDELETFRCADGCQQLAREMAAEIRNTPGCRLERNRMVSVIDILSDKVKLKWGPVVSGKPLPGAGQSEDFEFVILAIPPSVWDDVTIKVGGEAVKLRDKIGPVGMARAVKFFSEVERRFWINNRDKAAPYGGSSTIGQVWEGTDNQTRLEGRHRTNETHRIVLSVFAGPIRPGGNVPTPVDFKNGLEVLYPGYTSQLTKPPHFANWPEEPFIMTGYVSPTKGQILTIGQKLSEPFDDRLFFAGEHTQMDFFGYMEGALRSGERAAHTLMLKKCGLLKESAPKSPSRPPQRPVPKSSSPPIVARAEPRRETTSYERKGGFILGEHSSSHHSVAAESPFFHQELFAKKAEEELEPRAAALAAESPFVGAALEARRSTFNEDRLKDEEDEFEDEQELEAAEVWEELEEEQLTSQADQQEGGFLQDEGAPVHEDETELELRVEGHASPHELEYDVEPAEAVFGDREYRGWQGQEDEAHSEGLAPATSSPDPDREGESGEDSEHESDLADEWKTNDELDDTEGETTARKTLSWKDIYGGTRYIAVASPSDLTDQEWIDDGRLPEDLWLPAYADYALMKVLYMLQLRNTTRQVKAFKWEQPLVPLDFSGLKDSDIIFIVAHGNQAGLYALGPKKQVNMKRLIEILTKDGNLKTKRKNKPITIVLLSCRSGLGLHKALAHELGKTLGRRVTVVGARGFTFGSVRTNTFGLNDVLILGIPWFMEYEASITRDVAEKETSKRERKPITIDGKRKEIEGFLKEKRAIEGQMKDLIKKLKSTDVNNALDEIERNYRSNWLALIRSQFELYATAKKRSDLEFDMWYDNITEGYVLSTGKGVTDREVVSHFRRVNWPTQGKLTSIQ